MVPSPERRRSKKSFFPSSIFPGVWGFPAGTGGGPSGARLPAWAGGARRRNASNDPAAVRKGGMRSRDYFAAASSSSTISRKYS